MCLIFYFLLPYNYKVKPRYDLIRNWLEEITYCKCSLAISTPLQSPSSYQANPNNNYTTWHKSLTIFPLSFHLTYSSFSLFHLIQILHMIFRAHPKARTPWYDSNFSSVYIMQHLNRFLQGWTTSNFICKYVSGKKSPFLILTNRFSVLFGFQTIYRSLQGRFN